ncbi:ISNCY family transposase [bacterium]|nr:ISNCY family transposase [bacterium]
MKLLMSDKERNYSKVLEQLRQGQLKRTEAAALMGCTPRHVTRLRRVYREHGDAGLVHGLRGQSSHRRCDPRLLEQAVALVAAHYHDAGPTYAADRLAADHGLVLSHERLRQAMIAAGLWRARPRKAKHRQWRERKPCFGQLVQMDTSEHDWFEGRGEAADLVLMIDDATSRAHLRFVPADNSETNRRVIHEYLQRHGRPLALYTDKASHFVVNRPATVMEQLDGREAETQIGRALRELQIELIVAHSPQAKGRAERFFGTAQDRLVKDLRYADIHTIDAANRYLEEHYLPWWQAHHTIVPASPADAHRDLQGFDVEAILSHQEPRQVQNDYTFSYERQRYQILPDSQLPNLRKHTVTVQQRLDGRVMAWAKGQYLQILPIPAGGAAAAPEAAVASRNQPHSAKARTPAPDHPWRKSYQGTFLSGRKRDISTLR